MKQLRRMPEQCPACKKSPPMSAYLGIDTDAIGCDNLGHPLQHMRPVVWPKAIEHQVSLIGAWRPQKKLMTSPARNGFCDDDGRVL